MSIEITASTPVIEAVRLYWLNQIKQINKCVVSLSDPEHETGSGPCCNPETIKLFSEAIHALRVAVRRCQSIALSFALYLPDKWPDRANKALRPLRKMCNDIRDMDILIVWLEGQQGRHPAMAVWLDSLLSEQWRAYLNLIEVLADKDFLRDARRFEDRLIQSESGDKQNFNRNYCIQDITAAVLMTRAAAMTVYRGGLPENSEQKSAKADLHRLRIAVKDFRYTLEMLEATMTNDSEFLHEQFRRFQDSLGELHDRIRIGELLNDLALQKRMPDDLTTDLQTELASQKLGLWQSFSEQWQIMTPKWFAKAVLSAVMHNNSD